jgi:predicted metal-binding protein
MDLPTGILFSNERSEVFGLLHEIASGIEHSAAGIGYPDSKAYAGGSCKTIFCQDQPNCRMKDGEGQCRNPLHARPSMSGFGINVSKLIRAAGWTMNWSTPGTTSNKTAMGTVCGLVLIG